jgi:hypothetical protein
MNRHRGILQSVLLSMAILARVASAPAVTASEPEEVVNLRPDPEGQATRVSVGIFLVDVADIDDAKRTFTADLYIFLRWKDPRLASPKASPRILPLTTVWHPNLLILNQRNVDRKLPEVVSLDRQGNVEYDQRLQGTFAAPLNLRNFPVDEQMLPVRIVSPGNSPAQLELVPDERGGVSRSSPFWTGVSVLPRAIRTHMSCLMAEKKQVSIAR